MSHSLQPVRAKNENMRAFAYRIIYSGIREMALPPGHAMSEAKMAEQLRISRTPVHDTFAQLYREGVLDVAPQAGTFVRCISPSGIRGLSWMNLTVDKSVFEQLYSMKPSVPQLSELDRITEEALQALGEKKYRKIAGLVFRFFQALFSLAGYDMVYSALERISTDLYRLIRLTEDEALLRKTVDCLSEITQALAAHDHDRACAAAEREYSLFEPMLRAALPLYPQYFIGSEPVRPALEAENELFLKEDA